MCFTVYKYMYLVKNYQAQKNKNKKEEKRILKAV
jgi:hypothetical protein